MAEACRAFDMPPSEIEGRVDEAKRSMENALQAKPLEVREQHGRQIMELLEACDEAMLGLRARKSWRPCWARKRSDSKRSAKD